VDKLYSIRSSLEKILKALIIKLENGDELSVSEELIWFDDLVERIYNLLETEPLLFQEIVDPNKRFKYVEPIDFAKIDWSKVKLKEGSRNPNKSYPMSVIESQYDILDSIFSFGIHVWEAGIKYDRFEVSKRALYALGNLHGIISIRIDKNRNFNYITYYNYYCQKLTGIIGSLLSKKNYSEDNGGLISYLLYLFHLDHFNDDRFPRDKTEIFYTALFQNLKLCIDSQHVNFINDFVRSASHRNLLPLWPHDQSKLDLLAYNKIKDPVVEARISKRINDLTFNTVREIFTQKEYAELSDQLNLLKKDIIDSFDSPSSEDSDLVSVYLKAIDDYAYKRYKYKLVQKALNHTLIYCIFKKQYSVIDFAFNFHRPDDTDATWGNDDIIFDDLFEILKLISFRWDIQSDLTFVWPDHHGTPIYIDTYFIALIDRWIKYHHHDGKNLIYVQTYHLIVSQRAKGRDSVISWIRELKDIFNIARRLQELKYWPFQNGDIDRFDRFQSTIQQISYQFEDELKKYN
jgi:hypothetical protein